VDTPDLRPYHHAERLEWHAWTVFDGEQADGDGNLDGELRAIRDGQIVARVPVDIFTPAVWEALDGPMISNGPWVSSETGSFGLILADPRTPDAVRDEIRRWCQHELGRDDVAVTL
jgi:hypothetical protein